MCKVIKPAEKRVSGIEIFEDFEWGTYISSFYDSKKDLLDILVPYFKAGIESNEFCLWITADPISPQDAFEALQKEVPKLEEYILSRRIEILSDTCETINSAAPGLDTLINQILQKLQSAENRGMAGMRIHEAKSWNEKSSSTGFIDRRRQLKSSFTNDHIIVLSSCPLYKCDAETFIDIAQSKDPAIVRRQGNWESMELPDESELKKKISFDDINLERIIAERTSGLVKANALLIKELELRKSSEDSFKKTEQHYREIFEKASDAIFILEKETGKIIDANLKAVKITGYTRDELINAHPSDISSGNTGFARLNVDEKIDALFLSGDQLFEWEMCRKDGSSCWISVNLSPATITGVERILCFFHEMDMRKSVELSLLQSESNYRYLFENNPASIYIWDPFALNIIEVNNTALETYGYCRKEFLELSTLDLRPEEDLTRYYEFLKFAQTEGDLSLKAGIWRHIKKDGEIIFVSITSHKIQYRGTSAVLSMNINITEKVLLERRFEEERIKKQHEITDAVIVAEERERQEIGRELHDNVNQLLATARLYLGLTKNDNEKILTNVKEADHLIEVAINEIRNLSHAMISPMLEKTGLINALKYLMDAIAKGSALQFDYNLDSIDETALPDKLKLSIYRIVQEQLSNILKYANAEKVMIQLLQKNNQYLLTIKDNGVGFNREEKRNGIGLMNIHTRASLFNGNVHVNTAIGNGCELAVSFVVDVENDA